LLLLLPSAAVLAGVGCGDDGGTDIPEAQWAYARQITDTGDLIGGPIADGQVGDYLIGNAKVRFVIQGADDPRTLLPYGGTVIDADVVRSPGEPGQDRLQEVGTVAGYIRLVRPTDIEVVSAGRSGKPAIIRVTGVDGGMPLIDTILPLGSSELAVQIDYILEPGAESLRIETTYTSRKESGSARPVKPGDALLMSDLLTLCTGPEPGCGVSDPPLRPRWISAHAGDAVAYAYFTSGGETQMRVELQQDDLWLLTAPAYSLGPLESATFTRYLAVAAGPAGLWPEVLRRQHAHATPESEPAALATVAGTVTLDDGGPAPGAAVDVRDPDGAWLTRAIADADGAFSARVEPGPVALTASAGLRVTPDPVPADTSAGDASGVALSLPAPAWVELDLRDADDVPLPARVDFHPGHDATPVGRGEHTFWSVDGGGRLELPPGDWTAVVTRGYEYDTDQVFLTAVAGQSEPMAAALTHVVDTQGYLAVDPHSHTRYSIDSQIDERARVAQAAAEHVEVVVNTEHDVIYDMQPDVVRVGAQGVLRGVPGIEISPLYGHINAYPVSDDDADRQKSWPVAWWVTDEQGEVIGPRNPTAIFADLRDKLHAQVIQLNHPREGQGVLNFADYDPVVGFDGVSEDLLSTDFDTVEIQNAGYDDSDAETLLDWYSFLNQGLYTTAVGVSDSHGLSRMLGVARTLVAVPDDVISQELDLQPLWDNLRAQRATVVCGPFVELWALADAGADPSEAAMGQQVTRTSGPLRVRVRVQAAPFVQTARLHLVVNGQTVQTLDLPAPGTPPAALRLDQELDVDWTGGDAWIVAIVEGDQPMWPLVSELPRGVTNPVYVDRDGDGAWTPPGL